MRNDIDYIALGKRIQVLLIRRGMTQAQLSMITGISESHLSHIISGSTKVSAEGLIDIADALGDQS